MITDARIECVVSAPGSSGSRDAAPIKGRRNRSRHTELQRFGSFPTIDDHCRSHEHRPFIWTRPSVDLAGSGRQ